MVTLSTCVRNCDVIFDRGLVMHQQISVVCSRSRSSGSQITNVGEINKCFTPCAAEQITHSFVTPGLDGCN